MKKFDKIANDIFLKLLEAGPGEQVPAAAPAATPAQGLDTTGGPQPPPKTGEPAPQSPTEIKNWETELLDIAKDAIMNVRNNPNSVTEDDVKVLTMPVTVDNKDKPGGVMDILNRLAGKA